MGETTEISRRARIMRELVLGINRNNFYRETKEQTRGISDIDKEFKYPAHIKVNRIDMQNFSMELLEREDMSSDFVILQLHGGGYVGALKNIYRTFAGLYSEVGSGAKVLTIDYRVAPENKYPAALEDALAAYDWLLEQGYPEDKIIFAGDSAGGGLAMSLCHKLKDDGRKLPKAIVAMSPWTDLTLSGESYITNKNIDPLFGSNDSGILYDNPYATEEEKKHPYVSPLFGNFEGFPDMLVQVGSHEMLLCDSKAVCEKAKDAGVKVKYSEYQGMFHVFQMGTTFMPESKKAWAEIAKFLQLEMDL